MCYILATPSLKKEHIDIMRLAWISNHDGAGIAHFDGILKMIKPLMTWKSLKANLKRLIGQPVIAHCRLATHGNISGKNTHPFWTCKKKALLSHNGIMPAPWSADRNLSDSRRFADMLMRFTYEEIYASSPRMGNVISGNKVAIMQDNGDIFIINQELGYTENGDWYSCDPNYLCEYDYMADGLWSAYSKNGHHSRYFGHDTITYIENGESCTYYPCNTPEDQKLLTNGDDDSFDYYKALASKEFLNKKSRNNYYGKFTELEGECYSG